MKLHKFVSYTSLMVIAIAILLLASSPFRFPNSYIYWKPAILFLSPAVVLVVLLFLKPLLSSKVFLSLIVLLVGAAVWGTIASQMSPIMFGIFLIACFALYISSGIPQLNFRRK